MASQPTPGFWYFVRSFARGVNIVRLVIVNLIFFPLLFLVLLFVFGLFIGSHTERVADSSVLVIKPEGQLVEQYSLSATERAMTALSGDTPKQVQVRDLVAAIDAAAKDNRITRILLLPDRLQAGGFAALREVSAALDRFRAAGKPVIVWGASFDQGQYYLAVHSDRVLIDPQGGVMLTGLANYRLFYKDLLDKLGIEVHLFRVGQFKSAAEPYILDHASAESKEADSFWMGGLWDQYIADVAKQRKLEPAALRADIDGLPDAIAAAKGDLGKLSLDQHLVDGLATQDELEAMMRREGVPAGKGGHGFRSISLAQYTAQLPSEDEQFGDSVAVVVAEGEIAGGKQPAGHIGGDSTAALVRAARESRKTKALVLRVNSPGGEVYAAEQIRREVELTREAGIPVVVSMGDVAASGGYWISMNADRIYAEPNTITGSIGIFGMYFNIPGTLDKIGVKSDGVATSPLAGAFDMTRPLDPKVSAVIQSIIDKGYRDFVGNVAKARGKDFAAIDAIAQGRVWTGQQALDRGLVDQLGGLGDAIADAASRAKLGKNYPVRYIKTPPGLLDQFLAGMSESAAIHVAQGYGLRLPSWMAQLPRMAPELGLLSNARSEQPNVYSYCFCTPR
ncbi:MAG TPA: signal peptide peptidase SppA [Dyella sp.]|uniref:signal peptide peptidase SppA n=1 Tax=Dyella sp. TaxID=1869338 RepID=UPI002F92AC23